MILAQVRAVAGDIGVDTVKIGMLGDEATIEAVAQALEELRPGLRSCSIRSWWPSPGPSCSIRRARRLIERLLPGHRRHAQRARGAVLAGRARHPDGSTRPAGPGIGPGLPGRGRDRGPSRGRPPTCTSMASGWWRFPGRAIPAGPRTARGARTPRCSPRGWPGRRAAPGGPRGQGVAARAVRDGLGSRGRGRAGHRARARAWPRARPDARPRRGPEGEPARGGAPRAAQLGAEPAVRPASTRAGEPPDVGRPPRAVRPLNANGLRGTVSSERRGRRPAAPGFDIIPGALSADEAWAWRGADRRGRRRARGGRAAADRGVPPPARCGPVGGSAHSGDGDRRSRAWCAPSRIPGTPTRDLLPAGGRRPVARRRCCSRWPRPRSSRSPCSRI